MNRRLPAVALSVSLLALTLVACAVQPEPEPATASPTPSTTESDAAPTASPEPVETEAVNEPDAADPTCETIIAPSTIDIFEEHEWTYKEDVFRIGADVVEGGIQCVWGDYTVASDHVQVFGWAPLSAADSGPAQQKLISEGWIRADEDGRTYITEDPDLALSVDESGYGMTYEFGDGWVTLADTKQSLVLITKP